MKVFLIYTGRRVFDSDKGILAHSFIEKKDLKKKDPTEVFFIKARYLLIGHIYEVTKDGKFFQWPKCPTAVDSIENEEIKAAWESEDAAAEGFAKKVKAWRSSQNKAKQIARESTAIQKILRGMRYHGRRYFVEALMDEFEKIETERLMREIERKKK